MAFFGNPQGMRVKHVLCAHFPSYVSDSLFQRFWTDIPALHAASMQGQLIKESKKYARKREPSILQCTLVEFAMCCTLWAVGVTFALGVLYGLRIPNHLQHIYNKRPSIRVFTVGLFHSQEPICFIYKGPVVHAIPTQASIHICTCRAFEKWSWPTGSFDI